MEPTLCTLELVFIPPDELSPPFPPVDVVDVTVPVASYNPPERAFVMKTYEVDETCGAVFDASGAYRYRLWRSWEPARPIVAFIMLNPSTADAKRNDPTIRRCIGFARDWGYGGLEVVNLFAYRTVSPRLLQTAVDPIGPENDQYILQSLEDAGDVILVWGNHGSLRARDRAVLRLLAGRRTLRCLGVTGRQQPRHPLYLSRATTPRQLPDSAG